MRRLSFERNDLRSVEAPKHPPRSATILSDTFLEKMVETMASHYKPVYEAIRAKLSAETERRAGKTVEEWILTERECVLREVNRQRSVLTLDPVSIADVERAERMAVGHSDYVSKYAHAAADLVLRKERA
jgi:hypothetical protein